MNRIDRLFGITTLLQSRKYVPAEKIAEQFEISLRTVYRDIRALGEQGIPISYEQHKGYFLADGYFLRPVAFTSQEANTLLLLDSLVNSLADKSIQAHYAAILQKVTAVLREPQKARLEQLTGHIKMDLPEYGGGSSDYLATLQSAISDQHIIAIDYRDKNGLTSQRQVEPIGLAFYNFAWHLIGWCHLRRAYRDFRLTRIDRLTATNLPFKQPQHLSLTDYIASLNLPQAV